MPRALSVCRPLISNHVHAYSIVLAGTYSGRRWTYDLLICRPHLRWIVDAVADLEVIRSVRLLVDIQEEGRTDCREEQLVDRFQGKKAYLTAKLLLSSIEAFVQVVLLGLAGLIRCGHLSKDLEVDCGVV